MKRFPVHAHADVLPAGVACGSERFATEPARIEDRSARWMLDDPRKDFANATRSGAVGIDPLGVQTDDEAKLAKPTSRVRSAHLAHRDGSGTTCCPACSGTPPATGSPEFARKHVHPRGDVLVFAGNQSGSTSACRGTSTPSPVETPKPAASCCA